MIEKFKDILTDGGKAMIWKLDFMTVDKNEPASGVFEDYQFEYWWSASSPESEYQWRCEILPTVIIHGNEDYGMKETRYIYLLQIPKYIGISGGPYDDCEEAMSKAHDALEKYLETVRGAK